MKWSYTVHDAGGIVAQGTVIGSTNIQATRMVLKRVGSWDLDGRLDVTVLPVVRGGA